MHRDDLHAENDDEGGACPSDITQCLEGSKPHSARRERVTASGGTSLQNRFS